MAKKKVETVNEGTPAADTLKTRSAALSGLIALTGNMSNDQLMQFWDDAKALAGPVSNGAAAQNQASVATGKAVKEDTETLFGSDESLTEEAKEKISVLIETAVNNRVSLIEAELEESYETKLVEESSKIQEALAEKTNTYLTYVAEEWVKKNEVAIEASLKVAKADKLMEGLKALFAECNIELPAETNVVEGLEADMADLKTKLNEQIEANIALKEEVLAGKALVIFNEVAEGLTVADVEKFRSLIEDIEIDEDLETLKRKITIVREAHFKGEKLTESTKKAVEGLTEVTETTVEAGQAEIKEEMAEIEDPFVRSAVKGLERGSRRYARGTFAQ
jgi:hypothetical protein